MPARAKEKQPLELNIRVLGYKEGGEWVALALEMDLRGYGKTFDAAFAELKGTVEAHFLFAYQKEDLGLLDYPAEDRYFRMFDASKDRALESYFQKAREGKVSRIANKNPITFLPYPDINVIANQEAEAN